MEHTKNGVPLFNGNNYVLSKGRMEVFLLAQGNEVCETIQNGFTTTVNEGKNNLVNYAKAKNIIISGVIESSYHNVLGCKTTQNVWDKLENIYAGDSNVKEAKLQIYRAKFEQLIMKEDDNIVAYFQHVDEITNTQEGLGEPLDEKNIIRKILRMLPGRFNQKVSVLEYSANLDKLNKDELHGVLIEYEMRLNEEEGTSHLQTTFTTSKKTNKDKCKHLHLHLCGEVGNFAAKCLNRSDGNSEGKKGFKKFNKQGKQKGFKRNFLSKEDSSSSDEDSDSEEEANEIVLFMAKHNKQEVSNNEEEGLTIE
eukprot:PITA_15233